MGKKRLLKQSTPEYVFECNNVMMWFLEIWSLEFKGTLDPFRLSSLDNWFTLRLAANLKLKEHVNSTFHQVHQRPNLKNLSRGLNPPKPGLNEAPA